MRSTPQLRRASADVHSTNSLQHSIESKRNSIEFHAIPHATASPRPIPTRRKAASETPSSASNIWKPGGTKEELIKASSSSKRSSKHDAHHQNPNSEIREDSFTELTTSCGIFGSLQTRPGSEARSLKSIGAASDEQGSTTFGAPLVPDIAAGIASIGLGHMDSIHDHHGEISSKMTEHTTAKNHSSQHNSATAETVSTGQTASSLDGHEHQPTTPSALRLRALHSKNYFGTKRYGLKDSTFDPKTSTDCERTDGHPQPGRVETSKLIAPGEIRFGMSSYSTSNLKAGLGDSHFVSDSSAKHFQENNEGGFNDAHSVAGLREPPDSIAHMSHRQLEMAFLNDFTVLEKRQNTATINAIHRHHIRDMKVFGHTYIRSIDWSNLENMIFTFYRFHAAQKEALIPANVASDIIELTEDELPACEMVAGIQRILERVPRLYYLRLKMHLIHLQRLSTALPNLPHPLYDPFADIFSSLFFRFPSRRNRLHELDKKHGNRSNSSFHRNIEQLFASEFASEYGASSGHPLLRATSITETMSSLQILSDLDPVSAIGGSDTRCYAGLGRLNARSALSYSSSNATDETRSGFPSTSTIDIRLLSDGNGASFEPEQRTLHDTRKSNSNLASRCNIGSASAASLMHAAPGFRDVEKLRLIRLPSATEIQIPAESPFAPKTKDELAELEFEKWSEKFGESLDRNAGSFNAGQGQIDLRAQSHRKRLRAQANWSKARSMVLDRRRSKKKKFTDLVRDALVIAQNSIQCDSITVDGVVVFSLKEKPALDLEGYVPASEGDMDTFGWNAFRKEDIGPRIFTEAGCPTATSAALAFILRNLEGIFGYTASSPS
ncbi:hypothetical protein HDU81_009575 [Chytriomyces hyalinus]|nr:hypothetical protein HDU81_009575 [Chytriomyces hyalinus]